MIPSLSSRARAGALLVAFALVGGTGCYTMSVVKLQPDNPEREAARQRTVTDMTPRAAAGDDAAARTLAYALLTVPDPARPDLPRVAALLSAAAARGDARAQAWLGRMLVDAYVWTGGRMTSLPPAMQDRARGIALLQQAATQACSVNPVAGVAGVAGVAPALSPILPAFAASRGLLLDGRTAEAQVWHARSVLHCAMPQAPRLAWNIESKTATQAQRIESMALLFLTGDAAAIAKSAAVLAPADAAAAERRAADLRRLVAASERDYPAPPRKELP